MQKSQIILFILVLTLTFQVYGQDSSKESNFGVSVVYRCGLAITTFNEPGRNGVIAQNQTDAILAELTNTGNFKENITVRYMNITKQNESYNPEDDADGPVMKEFNGTNYSNVPSRDYRIYIENYTATQPEGYYSVNIKVNGFCNTSEANNATNDTTNITIERSEVFRIVSALGNQSGVNSTGSPTPAEADRLSNSSTNQTTSRDVNRTGSESNQTLEQQANRTGEEGSEVEGDNAQPGVTPEPEPEPEPDPDPRPQLTIDMEPVNGTYNATQGDFAPALMEISNIGTADAEDITISPEIDEVRPEWGVQDARIANLSVNETVTREVFVQPPDDQPEGRYLVPVRAHNIWQEGDRAGQRRDLDLDYFTVNVVKDDFVSQMSILESPRSVSVQARSQQPLPILVKNTGETNLTNVTARIQNLEDCGAVETQGINYMDINETGSVTFNFTAGESSESCNGTVILSSNEGAYAFSDISVSVRPRQGLIPEKQRVPLIAIIWTFILAAYAVLRKQYDLNSSFIKIPFVLLLMGETLIILFMVVNYYGVVSVGFLPF